MAPGLAKRHPGIKTYSGRGITDLSATIHADLTPLGFRASVRSANGNWYIDPYRVTRSPSVYASYFVRNAENTGHANNDTVVESAGLPVHTCPISHRPATDLRTYRTALISDPGYSAYHGGPGNMTAAKVALMNRVTHIYEDDLHDPAAADREQRSPQPQHVCPRRSRRTGPAARWGASPWPKPSGCSIISGRNRIVIGQIIGAGKLRPRPP